MKYDHAVKYKGVYYSTGANVPVEEETKENKDTKTEPKKAVKK